MITAVFKADETSGLVKYEAYPFNTSGVKKALKHKYSKIILKPLIFTGKGDRKTFKVKMSTPTESPVVKFRPRWVDKVRSNLHSLRVSG